MSRESQPRKKRKVIPIICRVLGIIFILAVIVTALPLTIPKLLGYEIPSGEAVLSRPKVAAPAKAKAKVKVGKKAAVAKKVNGTPKKVKNIRK